MNVSREAGVVNGIGRRAGFDEFGVALADEVLTPRYLETQLNAALAALLKGPVWLSGFPAELRSARAAATRLVAEDGHERQFAVTVRAELAAEVGPRTLAFGIDTEIEVDLTARVRAFRPAVIGIEIDPVVPDDVRIATNARSDWLPRMLLDDGGARLAGVAQRSLPLVVVGAVNRALAASTERRQVDVLERIRRFQQPGSFGSSGPAGVSGTAGTGVEPVRTGTLGPGERLDRPLELAEQESARLRLWAGYTGEGPGERGAVTLSVQGPDGATVAGTTLPVRRHTPDLDIAPAPLTVTTNDPAGYRMRLENGAGRPVAYRIAEERTVVPGRRIGFAEFGTVLIERGVDRWTVGEAVARQLARHAQSMFAAPALVRGTATPRLVEITDRAAGPDERCFGLLLDIGLELLVGPGSNATVLAATLRAEVPLRITTTVGPAALRLEFGPVPADQLRVVSPPRRVGGRYLPIPERKLTELLPGQVAVELNRRLSQASRRIVATDLALGPPPGFTEPHVSLRSATRFSGTASAGDPGRHPVRLTDGQRILVTARVEATSDTVGGDSGSRTRADAEGGTPDDGPAAELAVCDEHGGVWAADRAPVRVDEPATLEVRFTAPEAGQWRLRILPDGDGDVALDYRIRVRPQRAEDGPDHPDPAPDSHDTDSDGDSATAGP